MTHIIQGSFRRRQWLQPWWLSDHLPRLIRPFVLLLVIGLGGTVVVYGMTIQIEAHINTLGQTTRNLNEANKSLEVELDRAKSFSRIAEKAAQSLPSLHLSEDVIDVPANQPYPLPTVLPIPVEPVPHAPGY